MISGSLRSRSSNTAVLRTAAALAPPGVTAVVFDGMAGLPHLDPDLDTETPPPAVAAFREALHLADAVLFCVPEYAGALPGSFKNLLDWTIGDAAPRSILDKPVAWINASPRGAAGAHAELRTVLGYAHAAVVDAACAHVPVTSAMIGDGGVIEDEAVRAAIAQAVAALVDA